MKILITGGTGLLGSDLCRRLSPEHEVTAWSRRLPENRPAGWSVEQRDLTEDSAARRGIERLKPDLVLHAAAMTDVDACERDPEASRRLNVEATEQVASACAGSGAALMGISTDYVFDGALDRPYRETDAPNPINVYGRSKLEGERRVLSLVPAGLIVRVSGLFGSRRDNFVSLAARKFRANETVPAVSDQVNSPSYTVDLADGIAKLIRFLERDRAGARPGGPLHGIFHLANRGGASRLQVAEWIADLLGKPRSLIRETRWADLGRPARRPVQSHLDCGRFAALCGSGLRPWEEAVRAFLC